MKTPAKQTSTRPDASGTPAATEPGRTIGRRTAVGGLLAAVGALAASRPASPDRRSDRKPDRVSIEPVEPGAPLWLGHM